MKITVHENEAPVQVCSIESLEKAIAAAATEARSKEKMSVIFLSVENGNEISMAVGGNETVLGFVYAHQNPPCLASKGEAESEEPVMTCYSVLEHHTEYPRSWVIPFSEGMAAVQEFFVTGDLPKSISWVEV